MYKIILLSVIVGSYMFAGTQGETDNSINKSDSASEQYNWSVDSSDDDCKLEAGRRRGKGNRARKRGGGGLR